MDMVKTGCVKRRFLVGDLIGSVAPGRSAYDAFTCKTRPVRNIQGHILRRRLLPEAQIRRFPLDAGHTGQTVALYCLDPIPIATLTVSADYMMIRTAAAAVHASRWSSRAALEAVVDEKRMEPIPRCLRRRAPILRFSSTVPFAVKRLQRPVLRFGSSHR